MPNYQEKELQHISKQFQIYGEILHAETFKIGHINETYSATYDQGGTRVRYIHQKINKNVFLNPPALMKNVVRVTTHIRKKLEAQDADDLTRRSLIIIPDPRRAFLLQQRRWGILADLCVRRRRADVRIGAVDRPGLRGGRAFGEFQSHLVDLARRAAHRDDPGFPQHPAAVQSAAGSHRERPFQPRPRGRRRRFSSPSSRRVSWT